MLYFVGEDTVSLLPGVRLLEVSRSGMYKEASHVSICGFYQVSSH